jgi:hypothetical protein
VWNVPERAKLASSKWIGFVFGVSSVNQDVVGVDTVSPKRR